jgi:hypothetical protein
MRTRAATTEISAVRRWALTFDGFFTFAGNHREVRVAAALVAAVVLVLPAEATLAGSCTFAGAIPAAEWSPDGGTLAAIFEQGSCPAGYVAVIDGTSMRTLASTPIGRPTSLAWSPGGRRLAVGYASDRRIVVYDVGAGVGTPIATGYDPAWSPDGRLIAYTHMTDGVHVVAPDGTGDRRAATGNRPSWSPDSTHIAYERSGSIFLTPADGPGEQHIAPGEDPGWSPSGNEVTMMRDGVTYIHPLDGAPETTAGRGRLLQWSPSGAEVVLLDGGVVRRVELGSGRKIRVAEDVVAASFRPQWDRVATILEVGRRAEIYLAEPTGARPTRITSSQCAQYTARCVHGTDRADRIRGSEDRDVVFPGAGDDRIWGFGGDDRIDTAYGRDVVLAGPGNDIVVTHGNDDRIHGGFGVDHIFAGNGDDVVHGGPGRDWIVAWRDDGVDRIRCGRGLDGVYADRTDRIAADCETVRYPNA